MANEFRTLDSHSAEYFGDTRDYWWNPDFLELRANGFRSTAYEMFSMLGVVSVIGVSCSRMCCQAARACKALIAIRFGSKRPPRARLVVGLPTASAIGSLSSKIYHSPMRASTS